jgi:flagellar protein FlbT
MMYLKNDIARYRTQYLGFLRDLREAAPGSREVIDAVNNHVSGGSLYKALKEIRKLMKMEQELPTMSACTA